MGVITAIPIAAGTPLHIGGIAQVAFRADYFSSFDCVADPLVINSMHQCYSKNFIFNNQGGITNAIYK